MATQARLYGPSQALLDPTGNLVIVDQQNSRIRRVNGQGNLVTIAGNNLHQIYAPGLPATSTGLDWPISAAYDAQGVLHFVELHSNRVAKIGADGRLTTVAGNGLPGLGGENVQATLSPLRTPVSIAFDSKGNLYISEQGNHRIRRVTPAGIATTFTGNGTPSATQLNLPMGIAFDSKDNLYIADMGNHRIRRVSPDGSATTIAGTGLPGAAIDNVTATESPLNFPSSVAVDGADNLYLTDWLNFRIRKVRFAGAPQLGPVPIVNAASFSATQIAPGSYVTILGQNLAGAISQASQVPLPTLLGGVSVTVNGKSAPLLYVSPTQVNAQLPYDLAGNATLKLTNSVGSTSEVTFPVLRAAPAIYTIAGTNRGVVVNQDGGLNGPEAPELRGNYLVAYVTGLGAVNPAVNAGEAASLTAISRAVQAVSATIGGLDAPVAFAGLTPGFVGLGQVNVQIPANAPRGELPLVFTAESVASNAVMVTTR